jgi:hypothetical protein
MKFLKQLSLKEWLSTLIIASAAFLLLGTITAIWNNSFFIRMTEVNGWDYIILSFESLLIGLFFGIQASHCATKKAGIGGVFGFIGFGCSVCNKILLLLFGSSFLLSYFEPVRHYVGALGLLLFSYALIHRWLSRLTVLNENRLQKETDPDSELVLLNM